MNNRHNQPRYRFEKKPYVPPENETPQERLARLLAAPKTIRDNKAFLAALRAAVKREDVKREDMGYGGDWE